MTLSKYEQRTLDEIEHALRQEDPQFANTVSFEHLRRHRSIVGGSAFLLGIALLFVGEIASQTQLAMGVIVSLAGFVVMVAAFAWTVRRPNHT
jgi:hypothetical protein